MSFGIPVRNGLGAGLLASTFLSSLRIGGRPALFLNFVNTTSLDSRVTFTRASTATFVGSNGLIQTAAINAPRFDYDPATLASKGLLIEEARTNLVLQSQTIATAPWSGDTSGGSVPTATNNAGIAPDGTNTATRLQINRGAGTFSRWNQSVLAVPAVTYVYSIYMKTFSGGTSNVGLRFDATGINCVVTGSWQRFSIALTATGATALCQILSFTAIPGTDVSADILVWGAQVEAGTFATSYIPTTTIAVTRSADNAVMTGTNFSSWYNQTEGTFVAAASTAVARASATRVLEASGGTAARVVDLNVTTGPTLQMFNGTATINATGAVTLNVPFKTAGAYKTANYGVVLNGGVVTTNAAALVNVANALQIGRFNSSSNYLNGHIRFIAYYNTRLPNATLQALTA